MPTYEYVCEKCECTFEKFQSIADKPLTVCPEEACGQKRWGRGRVKRQIGAGAGLLFKGSGFYITDYRSDNYKAAAKKDSAASSGGGGGAASTGAAGGGKAPAAKSSGKASGKAKAA